MGTFSTQGSRIANSSGAWQAICDTDVADWSKSNEFIVAIVATTNTHGGQSSSFKLQWGVGQAPVAWNDLTGTGAMKFGTGTSLVDCTQPCASLSGCNGGEAVTDSHESENDGTTPILTATAKNDLIEAQFAVNPADAADSAIYSFRLYDITADAALVVGVASVIIAGVSVIPKGFADAGNGSDVFAKVITLLTKAFVDTIGGADVFENLYRAMVFSDSIGGIDAFTIPWKLIPKAFADTIGGGDVFTLLRFLDFVDAIGGADVFTLTRPIYFTDVGGGIEVFSIPFKELPVADTALGSDVFTTPFRAMGFADAGSGIDIFTVFLFLEFADSVLGTDVFAITWTGVSKFFVDTILGTEVFITPYREMGFQDAVSGLDIFELLRFLAFVDSASGSDAFSLLAMMGFSDVGSGIDIFATPFRAMGFADVGSGTEVFFLLAEMGFTDVGAGNDVFTKSLITLIVTKVIVTTMT